MAGVGTIYIARQLSSRIALEIYALVLSAAGVIFFVSLPHVFANLAQVANGGVPGITAFILSAVLGTKVIVQVALFLGMIATASLAVSLTRSSVPHSLAF